MKSLYFVFVGVLMLVLTGCLPEAQSNSGVSKANAEIQLQANGLTVEQGNVKRRVEMENIPGKIQHLYILSAYSGQVIMYSSVKGKVTSSAKRLTPTSVSDGPSFVVNFGNTRMYTNEVLSDDGTYDGGGSTQYIYWWDANDAYHQQFIQGGMILHVSDRPLTGVHQVGINLSPEE